MIPKIIHYAWFGGKPIPDAERAYINGWKKLCPDYEFRFWSEANYDVTKHKYPREAYAHDKFAFAVDYARLDILYKYGGIFLDTDVELIARFDDLLDSPGFTGFEFGRNRAVNIGIGVGVGAEPENRVIRAMLDDYDTRSFLNPDGAPNLTTCVVYQNEVLRKLGLVFENRRQVIDGFVFYPTEYFSPMYFRTGEISITENTHSIHHYHASWMSAADLYRRALRQRLVRRCGYTLANALSAGLAYWKFYKFRALGVIFSKLRR
ncbi:MAG: glycosyl transferase [Oscillospiraceae bacterium]|jgi:hypothetical protein|nr:glycosyl transferase [Oscillospiraceae bacterium]